MKSKFIILPYTNGALQKCPKLGNHNKVAKFNMTGHTDP